MRLQGLALMTVRLLKRLLNDHRESLYNRNNSDSQLGVTVARYSPIAPVHLLRQLLDLSLLDNYLLLLAHDVIKHPYQYADLVADLYEGFGSCTIIMDNGVIENGAPVSLEHLLEAAAIVEANLVVGPDVLGDFEATKQLMLEQASTIQQDYHLMMIPQGNNLNEISECIDWMHRNWHAPIQYWGVPRWMANSFTSRQAIVNNINAQDANHGIHLLGMSKNLEDDIACTKMDNVMGIDSANPLVMGYNNRRINTPEWPAHMDRGSYWDACMSINDMTKYNVNWVHDVIGRP